MAKVYVITKGCYSDYGICTVTLDERRAQVLKHLYSDNWDGASIEEYELDESAVKEYSYVAVFNKAGTLDNLSRDYGYQEGWFEDEDGYDKLRLEFKSTSNDIDVIKKIAYDKRAEFLAKEANIT